MPTYAAFLRAINLGAIRKFPKAAIKAAVEGAGMTDVETYINTGNVRFTTPMRSRAKIEAALEKAFRGRPRLRGADLRLHHRPSWCEIAETADELWAEHGEPRMHYVTLFKQQPAAAAVTALLEADFPGETCVVDGRAAHALLSTGSQASKLLSSRLFANLGQGTVAQRDRHARAGAEVGLTRSRRRTERDRSVLSAIAA